MQRQRKLIFFLIFPIKKNRRHLEIGPSYSEFQSGGAVSSIVSSPTDTLHALKKPLINYCPNEQGFANPYILVFGSTNPEGQKSD